MRLNLLSCIRDSRGIITDLLYTDFHCCQRIRRRFFLFIRYFHPKTKQKQLTDHQSEQIYELFKPFCLQSFAFLVFPFCIISFHEIEFPASPFPFSRMNRQKQAKTDITSLHIHSYFSTSAYFILFLYKYQTFAQTFFPF